MQPSCVARFIGVIVKVFSRDLYYNFNYFASFAIYSNLLLSYQRFGNVICDDFEWQLWYKCTHCIVADGVWELDFARHREHNVQLQTWICFYYRYLFF